MIEVGEARPLALSRRCLRHSSALAAIATFRRAPRRCVKRRHAVRTRPAAVAGRCEDAPPSERGVVIRAPLAIPPPLWLSGDPFDVLRAAAEGSVAEPVAHAARC